MLSFVVPEWDQPTGGNLFNRFLITALRRLGVPCETLTFDQISNERAHPGALFIVDSLYLHQLHELREPFILLLHYRPSLQPELSEAERSRWREIEHRAFDQAVGVVVPSAFGRVAVSATNLAIIPPALCIDPDNHPRPQDQMRALMVANLVPGKGVLPFLHELERALALSPQTSLSSWTPQSGCLRMGVREFNLRIIGRHDLDPEYAKECRTLVRHSALLHRGIQFVGTVASREMRLIYVNSNLLLSASGMESFGMALHEARAFGIPILALNRGNCRAHVTEGVNGFLSSDINELVRNVLRLLSNPPEHKQLVLGAHTLRHLPTYSWEDAARKLLGALTTFHPPFGGAIVPMSGAVTSRSCGPLFGFPSTANCSGSL